MIERQLLQTRGLYEIWVEAYPGEYVLRHEFNRHNEKLIDVIKDAKKLIAEGECKVCVVEVRNDGTPINILWESNNPEDE